MKQTRPKYITVGLRAVLLSLVLAMTMPVYSAKAQETDPSAALAQTLTQVRDILIDSGVELPDPFSVLPEIQAIIEGSTVWTKAAWDEIVLFADQATIQIDALIPSISGCISQPDGTPLVNVPLVAWSLLEPMPAVALTSGGPTNPWWGIGFPPIPVPVVYAHLSPSQKANWEAHGIRGCYWMPLPPSLLQPALSPLLNGGSWEFYVAPLLPNYDLSPNISRVTVYSDGRAEIQGVAFGEVPFSPATTVTQD